MNPQNNNVPLQPSAVMPSKRQRKRNQLNRIPFGYKEAMKFISVKLSHYTERMQSDLEPEEKTSEGPTEFKWRSSFQAVDKSEEGPSVENTAASANRDELYNPFEPASSDSESEMPKHKKQNHSNPVQDHENQSLSPNQSCSEQSLWDSSVLRPGSRPLDSLDFENQGLSPGHRLTDEGDYSPETESLDPAGFDPISRPVDHQVCSTERVIPSSSTSTQPFPPSYGGQRTNGEGRMAVPEYRREVSPLRQMSTVRLSPPRLKRDHPQHLGYNETELDQIPPPNKVTRLGGKNVIMDKNPICCDLCDVELANGQELEDHLESKGHWGTMEHIQQHNNYDDVILAFLQDVMMYKSHQCSRAIEDCALPALQDNDHMTKIELFNCAACKVFVSTSASSVQTHITSQEHLDNTKEFKSRQRRVCLDKAETMMKELKPQFEHFLKGGSTSE